MNRQRVASFLAVAFLAIALCAATGAPAAAAVEKTGQILLERDVEKPFISGEKYEYTATLVSLESCDYSLSETMCIPSIAVMIYQKDVVTGEIYESTLLEHLSAFEGEHKLNISYDNLTLNTLNVVLIEYIDNSAKIELSFTPKIPGETNGGLVYQSADDDTINTFSGQRAEVVFTVINDGSDPQDFSVTVTRADTYSRLYVNNTQIEKGEEHIVDVEPGEHEVSIGFVPTVEGHQSLTFTVAFGEQTLEETVYILAHCTSQSSILYAGEVPFEEVMRDASIVGDIKMDSLYILGFSFVFLILGGVLGFIHSTNNRLPPM
jgi:hypothetical protein